MPCPPGKGEGAGSLLRALRGRVSCMDFANRAIIVTGGASGIGAETARLLRAAGAAVLTVDKASSADLRGDVTDPALVAAAMERHPRLDGLVTAAGISENGVAIENIRPEDWDRVFAVNVKATWMWLAAAARPMRAAGGGSIVTIASQLAFAGGSLNAAYIASKGAVVSLARTAAVELAGDGIRVNAVAPGATETPMLRRSFSRRDDPDTAREHSRTRHAMARFGRPEEIAEAICFLLSDRASFITGAALPVDGGWLAA